MRNEDIKMCIGVWVFHWGDWSKWPRLALEESVSSHVLGWPVSVVTCELRKSACLEVCVLVLLFCISISNIKDLGLWQKTINLYQSAKLVSKFVDYKFHFCIFFGLG